MYLLLGLKEGYIVSHQRRWVFRRPRLLSASIQVRSLDAPVALCVADVFECSIPIPEDAVSIEDYKPSELHLTSPPAAKWKTCLCVV